MAKKSTIKIKQSKEEFDPTMDDLDKIVIPGNMQGLLMVKMAEAVTKIDEQLRANIAHGEDMVPSHFEFVLRLKMKPVKTNTVQEIVTNVICKE